MKPRLLIVDDEPDMLDFLHRALRHMFAVSRCSNADEALERLDEGSYDVLITDHKMPRVTGLELLETLAERHASMVRILVSGFAEVPEIERARESGRIDGYIVKPVDSQRLLEAIDEATLIRSP